MNNGFSLYLKISQHFFNIHLGRNILEFDHSKHFVDLILLKFKKINVYLSINKLHLSTA